MNGELAQAAALTAHVRAALLSGEAFTLDLSHMTFTFVHAVTFDLDPRHAPHAPAEAWVGACPAAWHEHLVRSGTDEVALLMRPAGGSLPDPVASAFSGGGGWVIRTGRGGSGRVWRARWEVSHPQATDRRIWSVAYRGFEHDGPPPPGDTLPEARRRLADALEAAVRFSREYRLEPWRGIFADARQALDEGRSIFGPRPGLLPAAHYTDDARGLLSACERAWVFGGMGSWNDLGFDGDEPQRRYDTLSAELHAAVLGGITAAVNA